MTEHQDSIGTAIAKSIGLVAAWIGTVTLGQVQTFVAIISGLVVAGYAGTQWYFLLRDRRLKEKQHATD